MLLLEPRDRGGPGEAVECEYERLRRLVVSGLRGAISDPGP
jgi:hypothetical protein